MHLWRQKLLVETSCQIQGKHDLNGAKARFNMNIRPWNGKLLTMPTIITAVITSYELWPSHPLSVTIQMQYTCNAYVTSYWISTLRDYGHSGKSKIYVGIITFFFRRQKWQLKPIFSSAVFRSQCCRDCSAGRNAVGGRKFTRRAVSIFSVFIPRPRNWKIKEKSTVLTLERC